MKKAIVFVGLAALIGVPFAQTAINPERQRIASERATAQAGFDRQSAACYKKFWVNDCLDDVKAKRLEIVSDLRRQEVALNDQERKEKGAEQLQKLEAKASVATEISQQNERAVAVQKAQTRAERDDIKTAAAATASPKNGSAVQGRQDRQTAKQASQSNKQAQMAGKAEKYAAKQKKAEARQAKKRLELEAQKSKKQASPLPSRPNP